MIKGVKLVAVEVEKPDAAVAFFRDMLGFRVLTDQPGENGGRWIELGIASSVTRLALIHGGGQPLTAPRLSFFADDVEEASAALEDAGVRFILTPERRAWGSVAVFVDPEGNSYALSSKR